MNHNHTEHNFAPTLDAVLRGIVKSPPAIQRPGEPGVDSHGVYFDIEDYPFATHDIAEMEERAHVMGRNEMILSSLVLNVRPDLANKTTRDGRSFDDVCEAQVWIMAAMSQQLTETGASRSEVYKHAARLVILAFDGEPA